jgi:hemerythrin
VKPIVIWQDNFNLGMPDIDDQHKSLLDLINQVWNAVVSKAPVREQIRLVEELERYTISHFAAEEAFLKSIDYPEFEQHKALHEAFVKRVADEKANLASHGYLGLEIMHFLNDWLINHILGVDKKYAQFANERKKSSSLVGRLFRSLLGKS